jgi:hypothetical protein
MKRLAEVAVDQRNQAEADLALLKAHLDSLRSAVKIHRQATESRLRLLDSRGEAAKAMLKPDRDLYDVLDSLDSGAER